MPACRCVDARQPLRRCLPTAAPCPPVAAPCPPVAASMPANRCSMPASHCFLPASHSSLSAGHCFLSAGHSSLPASSLRARLISARSCRSSLVFCGCRLRRLRPAALSSLSLCRFSRSPPRLRQLFRLSSNTLSARVCSCDRPPLLSCRLRTLAGHAFGRRRGRGRVARVWLRQP